LARSDLLLTLVKAGLGGEHELFTRTVEAVIAEERAKSHHVLADSLAQAAQQQPKSLLKPLQVRLNSPASDLLLEQEPEVSFSDLLLPENVQKVASQLIEEQQRADLLRSYNLEPRHRVLLTGPPGNGKTSLAEAIATALCVPFFVIRYERIVNSYLGETAKKIQEVFQFARLRQCVLFFDEFDALGKEREDRQESGEIKRVLNSLLLEVDRLPSYVILVAATNHPDLLDRAVWRRFQIKTTLPLPDKYQIDRWFDLLARRHPEWRLAKSKKTSSQLTGASFSELQDLALNVMRRCVLDEIAEPNRVFQEQIKLWIVSHPKKGKARHGNSANSDFSNSRNSRKVHSQQTSASDSSSITGTSKRTNQSTNRPPRARVH
jgi:SpoVK/Ycf46/Vps4 family AAA+-type ATPase